MHARSQPHLAADPGSWSLGEGADGQKRATQQHGGSPVSGSREPLCLACSSACCSSSPVTSGGLVSGGFSPGIFSGRAHRCLAVGSLVTQHMPLPDVHFCLGTCPHPSFCLCKCDRVPPFSLVRPPRFTPACSAGSSPSTPGSPVPGIPSLGLSLGLRISPLPALCTCPVGSHPAPQTSICWFTAHPGCRFVSDHGSFVPVPPASISRWDRKAQNDNRKETPHLPGKASRPGAFLPDAR